MTDGLLIVVIVLIALVALLQFRLLFKKIPIDPAVIHEALGSVEKSYERAERAVREEIAKNREEATASGRAAREELAGALQAMAKTLDQKIVNFTNTNDQRLDRMRETVEQRLQTIQAENGKKLD